MGFTAFLVKTSDIVIGLEQANEPRIMSTLGIHEYINQATQWQNNVAITFAIIGQGNDLVLVLCYILTWVMLTSYQIQCNFHEPATMFIYKKAVVCRVLSAINVLFGFRTS